MHVSLTKAAQTQGRGSAPEMLIQKKVDGWIYTTVEKCQAGGQRESIKYDRPCVPAKISRSHQKDDMDGLEQIERKPGNQKGCNYGEHDLEGMALSGFCT